MSLDNLVSEAPSKGRESREFAGWKLPIKVEVEGLIIETEARYKKVDVEPLIDLEGEIEKVGPRGKPVKGSMEWHWYEGEDKVEISEKDIKYVQKMPDGSVVEVEPLQRVNEVHVEEKPIEEITIDGQTAIGTLVPRHMVENFAPESTYEVWGNLLRLAEYLEKNNLAIMFPWTFGRGFKITTALMYPVRVGEKVYMVMVLATGIKKFSKPLVGQTEEIKKPTIAKPLLKKKAVINNH